MADTQTTAVTERTFRPMTEFTYTLLQTLDHVVTQSVQVAERVIERLRGLFTLQI